MQLLWNLKNRALSNKSIGQIYFGIYIFAGNLDQFNKAVMFIIKRAPLQYFASQTLKLWSYAK
jgi:hypothetical protein